MLSSESPSTKGRAGGISRIFPNTVYEILIECKSRISKEGLTSNFLVGFDNHEAAQECITFNIVDQLSESR